MHLIVIGWIYVVFMMSITEQSIVAGVMTFVLYGVLPVTIIVYLGGSRRRRMKRQAEEELRRKASSPAFNAAIEAEQQNERTPTPEK